MPKCCHCKEIKSISEFYPRKGHGLSYCKLCNQSINREYKNKLQDKVIDILGGCCKSCGFRDRRALQIDHIYGGGLAERRAGKNWLRMYRQIIEGDFGSYQLLCANCNWIKRSEQNENRGCERGPLALIQSHKLPLTPAKNLL